MKAFKFTFFPLIIILILAACTPATTAEPTPIAQQVAASSTPVPPTATPEPTTTPEPSSTPKPTATPAPTATRTPRPTTPVLFNTLVEEPIIAVEQGTWKARYVEPGAAIFHDGQFHIFFNAFNSWPGHVDIGYATSLDGITWEEHPEPVFHEDIANVGYATYAIYASDVLVEEDGTWVLYFYTWENALASAPGVIGRATAPGPLGPWKADAEPILVPAKEDGQWDSYAVRNATVEKTANGYVMLYQGADITGVPIPQNDTDRIGMATSPDGLVWTKYNNPDTSEAPFKPSDPVLDLNEKVKWDGRRTQRPALAITPDGWVLFYRGNKGDLATGRQTAYGYAISHDDGITWERYEHNPVVKPSTFVGGSEMFATNMIYHDGVYYLFAEIGEGSTKTQVYILAGTLFKDE